jgi:Druantia protein DruA
MDCVLRYRGQNVTTADVEYINELIAAHPALSRRRLSTLLCQAWNWVQANGKLRTMVCRGLMLALHRAGAIELPPVRKVMPNPLAERRKPAPLLEQDWPPIQGTVRELGPIEIHQVRRTPREKLFGSLMEAYHYLSYTQPVGEHLKHLVYAQGTPIACLAWSSAPRHLAPRDQFIGWSKEQRAGGIRGVAYNSRFLILPWAKVPHLGSHLLVRAAPLVSAHWEKLYHHPIHLLETFIDPERLPGTCYRAAHWIYLGQFDLLPIKSMVS